MRMLVSRLALAAALAVGAGTLSEAFAHSEWRAVKQFSVRSNPNSVWSYIYSGGLLPSSTGSYAGIKHLLSWNDNENTPDFVGVTANKTGMTQTLSGGTVYFPTNYLELDGESDPLGADVRFTAPEEGVYHISGAFEGCDTQEQSHPVVVEVNQKAVYTATINSFESPLSFRIKARLKAKDVVDFISQGSGSGANLGTCLRVNVGGP
jgi:hypothetical protein